MQYIEINRLHKLPNINCVIRLTTSYSYYSSLCASNEYYEKNIYMYVIFCIVVIM